MLIAKRYCEAFQLPRSKSGSFFFLFETIETLTLMEMFSYIYSFFLGRLTF